MTDDPKSINGSQGPEVSQSAQGLLSEVKMQEERSDSEKRQEAKEDREKYKSDLKEGKGGAADDDTEALKNKYSGQKGQRRGKILKNAFVYAIIALSVVVIAYAVVCCGQTFVYTDYTRLCPLYLIVGMAYAVVLTFMVSSSWSYWNYYVRRKMFVVIVILLSGIFYLEVLYMLISAIIVPLLLLPEPNFLVTKSKWMFLIRVVTILPTLGATWFFVKWLFEFSSDRFVSASINGFRILNYVDLRKDKKYQYDAVVMKRMRTGISYRVKESDRYMHWLINGSTGTAKTSSIIIPMIDGDLVTRCLNEDAQKEAVWDGLDCDEPYFRLMDPITDRTFNINSVAATNSHGEEILRELKKKHRTIGITVIAPDDSLTDSTFKLCEAKNIPCNRVDPLTERGTDGVDKKGFIGFNPLFISPLIPEWQKSREIVKKATLFADVMQAINELKGKGDPYFTSINRSVTVAFSICLCVTYPLIKKRQPNPADVQEMVNDFTRIKPYYEKLCEIDKAEEKKTGSKLYGFVEDFIAWDVLGKGQEKMMEQARGLRMMMNEFLTNPLIRRTLCVDDSNTVDMDKMLDEGQITVLNYALELGETDSKGFGLFFLLSFIDAVFRRNGAEGSGIIPHVLIVDELPVIIHPQFERAISLFRKYKVSIVGCIQSLDQMKKNESTKYLSDVLMGGCATHTLFGRCGADEMERYSKLAGKEWVVVEQKSTSETSLTEDDPSFSFSERESLQQQEALEGIELRNRNFQEITCFTVRNGGVVKPYLAKVDFLDDDKWKWRKRKAYNWKDKWKTIPPTYSSATSQDMKAVERELTEEELGNMNCFQNIYEGASYASMTSKSDIGEQENACENTFSSVGSNPEKGTDTEGVKCENIAGQAAEKSSETQERTKANSKQSI